MTGHECDAPVSFSVDGVGIPIIDDGVTVHEQSSGPVSVSRRAEVTFPLTDGSTTWVDKIDAFKAGGSIQTAEVSMAPIGLNGSPVGEERALIRGYIHAVGSQEANNQGHVTILGPFKAISSIPAGISFNTATIGNVLRRVVDIFEEQSTLFDSVSLNMERGTGERVTWNQKKFTASRDTLGDVLKWVKERTSVSMWFEPDPTGGIQLTVAGERGSLYDLRDEETAPFLLANDALYEMKPFNAVTVKGRGGHTAEFGDLGSVYVPVDEKDYPEGTAWYPPLVERAGGRLTKQEAASTTTEDATAEKAEAELAEYLSDSTSGTMDLALAPQISPGDQVTAFPGCQGILDSTLPELTYEVQRTAHTLAPKNPENQIPQTELSVSISVDRSEIRSQATTKSAQPAEGVDNEPPGHDIGSLINLRVNPLYELYED